MDITAEMENFAVIKILVDQGSYVDILYWKIYKKLQFPKDAMIPYDVPMYGFSGERVALGDT